MVPGGLFQIQVPGAPIDTKKGGKIQMGIQWAKCCRGKSWFGGLESRQKGLSSPIW